MTMDITGPNPIQWIIRKFPPILKLLKNGVHVLGYGRPGTHLIFSTDGTGREWTEPVTLKKGDPEKWLTKTCGYLSVIPLDDHSFLVAYSDFEYIDRDGRQCKAILVKRIPVMKQGIVGSHQ